MNPGKYSGEFNTTETGRVCQKWSSQTPHSHSNANVGDHNKCRDPDGTGAPWCYTTDPEKLWEFCGVPMCSGKFF